MARINTVRGAVDSARLGVTLMHEHVFVLSTEIMQNYPEAWGDKEATDSPGVWAFGANPNRIVRHPAANHSTKIHSTTERHRV